VIDYSGMLSGILATYGEPVIVTVGGADFPLTAAFLEPYVGTAVGGVPVNRPNPQLLLGTDAWLATGAKNGAKVLRADTEYTVVDAAPSDDGMTVVNLRKYAS